MLDAAYSQLYLCISGKLAAVICISDPLRADAAQAVSALQHNMSALGISPKNMTNLLPPKERKEG